MKADVFFTPRAMEGADLQGHTAVVIDVLRASSTIVAALHAGAQRIYPVVSTEDALKLATSLGRGDALLAGERRGLKVEGFDLGNSPREFTPEAVAGKRIVMSTTNGTRALVAADDAARVLVGAFLNLSAVARAVAGAERLTILCAGRDGRFSIDDALCAGMLIARLTEQGAAPELEDTGRAALALAGTFGADAGFLAGTAAGRALVEAGLGEDIAWCARVDALPLVPRLADRVIARDDGTDHGQA
jgi:2-phosphosulfolactate phosphatase